MTIELLNTVGCMFGVATGALTYYSARKSFWVGGMMNALATGLWVVNSVKILQITGAM